MLRTAHRLVGLSWVVAVLAAGCGGGSGGESCGSANQCIAATSSGNNYSIRNACTNAVTVRWCEQYAGPTCRTDSGFESVFGGGQSRSFTAVRSGLTTVTFCAF